MVKAIPDEAERNRRYAWLSERLREAESVGVDATAARAELQALAERREASP